ncbi:hypothetical protein HK101_009313 [Irineochytrium annulatum]|nr:hypothetical protein HK101_009313 [Irineochytrium annulatum]
MTADGFPTGAECPWEHCGVVVPFDDYDKHCDEHKAEEEETKRLEEAARVERETFAELKRKERDWDLEDNPPAGPSAATKARTEPLSTENGPRKGNGFGKIEEGSKKALAENVDRMLHAGRLTFDEARMYRNKIRSGDNSSLRNSPVNDLLQISSKGPKSGTSDNRTTKAYLCHPSVSHYRTDLFDMNWGCGYRCSQMMMSALRGHDKLEGFRDELEAKKSLAGFGEETEGIPSVEGLQVLLEAGWKDGFDNEGSQQLGKSVKNSTKWIGVTDVAAILRYLGVRAEIHDFPKWTQQKGEGHPALIDFVEAYFDGFSAAALKRAGASTGWPAKWNRKKKDGVFVTKRMPLFCQYKGHSIVIVGYEETTGGARNLLTLNPGFHMPKEFCLKEYSHTDGFAKMTFGQAQGILRPLRWAEDKVAKKPQFQIMVVLGHGWSDDKEKSAYKKLKSERWV